MISVRQLQMFLNEFEDTPLTVSSSTSPASCCAGPAQLMPTCNECLNNFCLTIGAYTVLTGLVLHSGCAACCTACCLFGEVHGTAQSQTRTVRAAMAFVLAWLAHRLRLLYTAVVPTCVRWPAGLALLEVQLPVSTAHLCALLFGHGQALNIPALQS